MILLETIYCARKEVNTCYIKKNIYSLGGDVFLVFSNFNIEYLSRNSMLNMISCKNMFISIDIFLVS